MRTASPLEKDLSPEPAVAFVLQLGRALHDHGAPAHRLEDAMRAVSSRLDLEGQIFSTPTAIFASFVERGGPRTYLLRVGGGGVDLGRLAELDAVAIQVERGELPPREGLARIEAITSAPPRYGAWLTLACYALNSAAASRFFGGGLAEIAASLFIGLVIGALAHVARRRRRWAAFEAVAAFTSSALSIVLARAFPISQPVAQLAGIIVLLPGYTLTVAMVEVSTRHLASGSARLVGALMAFLTIAFGVALGSGIGSALVGPASLVTPAALPAWTEAAALLVAGVTFAVIFSAQRRDFAWIVLASFVSYGGARLGTATLGPELGAFVGALLLATCANVYARLLVRPAVVPLTPAIMLLVPGSIGFNSLRELMASDVVSGVKLAFTAVVVAVAIVTGLLLATEIVPPRRAL